MLVIVDLIAKSGMFPIDVLGQVDAAMVGLGFRKEVHSVTKPSKAYSVTYDGPNIDKSRLDALLRAITESNSVDFSFDVEESVKFP